MFFKVEKSKHLKIKKEGEFNQVTKEISDAHGDQFDTERNKRQHEAIENLKRVFPEKVLGRLIDLCTLPARKYQLPITKVIKKFK